MNTLTEAPAMINDLPSISRNRARTCSMSSVSSFGSVKSPKGSKAQRKSSSLPSETVEYLKAWMMSPEHVAHPYPTEQEKSQIMTDTGIELKQLTNWFVNNRKRYWKPRVEARLQHQAQVQVPTVPGTPNVAGNISGNGNGNVTLLVTSVAPSPEIISSSCESTCASGPDSFISLDMTQPPAPPTLSHHILPPGKQTEQARQQQVVSSVPSTAPHPVSEGSSASSGESDNLSLSNEIDEEIQINTVSPEEVHKYTDSIIPRADIAEHQSLRPLVDAQPIKRKRSLMSDLEPQVKREKYVQESPILWKKACVEAEHAFFDASLPSLDEAATLFGYCVQSSGSVRL